MPSVIIPFLASAYSRACEYTCDAVGAAFSPAGIKQGILILASGPKLFKKMNVDAYMQQGFSEKGFWTWLAEKFSSHPHLNKRLLPYKETMKTISRSTTIQAKPTTENDHSRFMPR
jgi:Zn-dependent protease with chaperone function